MIRIIVTGQLEIEGLSPEMMDRLITRFSLPNPTYEKAIRANPRARFALSPFIPYGKKTKTGSLLLPRGVFAEVSRLLPTAVVSDLTFACDIDDGVHGKDAGRNGESGSGTTGRTVHGDETTTDGSVRDRGKTGGELEVASNADGKRRTEIQPTYAHATPSDPNGDNVHDGGVQHAAAGDEEIYHPAIQLRPYQVGVVESFTQCDGVGRLDTGFGKTIIALNLAVARGQKTLIVVPKLDLLSQYQGDVKKFLGKEAGIITTKSWNIKNVSDITVITIQTLQRLVKIPSFKIMEDAFGLLIVDECHLMVPEKSRKAIEFFRPFFRYGLTGTARRSDGQGKAIEWIFGPILVDKKMPRSAPTVARVQYKEPILTQEYPEMIKDQVERDDRNLLIARVAHAEASKGRKVMVLTKRTDHYMRIEAQYRKHEALKRPGLKPHDVALMDSSAERLERAQLLKAMKEKPWDVMMGTFSLLGTGIDIPGLDTLIIAGDLRSDVLAEQSAGRILRLFDDKQPPLIIDVQDTNNFILKRQSREREAFYKSQGWPITDYVF